MGGKKRSAHVKGAIADEGLLIANHATEKKERKEKLLRGVCHCGYIGRISCLPHFTIRAMCIQLSNPTSSSVCISY